MKDLPKVTVGGKSIDIFTLCKLKQRFSSLAVGMYFGVTEEEIKSVGRVLRRTGLPVGNVIPPKWMTLRDELEQMLPVGINFKSKLLDKLEKTK